MDETVYAVRDLVDYPVVTPNQELEAFEASCIVLNILLSQCSLNR